MQEKKFWKEVTASLANGKGCHFNLSEAISRATKDEIAGGKGISPVISQWTCWKPVLPFTPGNDGESETPLIGEWLQ